MIVTTITNARVTNTVFTADNEQVFIIFEFEIMDTQGYKTISTPVLKLEDFTMIDFHSLLVDILIVTRATKWEDIINKIVRLEIDDNNRIIKIINPISAEYLSIASEINNIEATEFESEIDVIEEKE